ncbi:hypothetical protein CPB86DRAFT_793166 [Serendipita vermifera]|nr:hypothetical protein CPB86DRAFT_793166 [Serendipita vermifera]
METLTELIVTNPGQTGDIPHVAGALAISPETGVLAISEEVIDVNSPYVKFYEHIASPYKIRTYRPVIREVPPGENEDELRIKASTKLYNKSKDGFRWTKNRDTVANLQNTLHVSLTHFLPLVQDGTENPYNSLSVTGATNRLAEAFAKAKGEGEGKVKELSNEIGQKLCLKALTPEVIMDAREKWDTESHLADLVETHDPILLLWSRYSGQYSDTGYNPRGDSDPKGQATLIQMSKELGFKVITIGHGPKWDRKMAIPKEQQPDGELGQFYENEPMKSRARAGQMSFFIALLHWFEGRIVQMGQKTGAMDAAALLGMPTLFIEEDESPNFKRMEKWLGSVPGYFRAIIKEPPSPLGRALREMGTRYGISHGIVTRAADIEPDLRILAWVMRLHDGKTAENKNAQYLNKLNTDAILELAEDSNFEDWIKVVREIFKDPKTRTPEEGDTYPEKQRIMREWLTTTMQPLTQADLDSCGISNGYQEENVTTEITNKLREVMALLHM